MVDEATLTLVQYALLFVLSIVFMVLALERKTLLTNLISSIFWCALALANFMIGYTIIGAALSWIFGIVCFVMMGNFILQMYNSYIESAKARYQFEPF